MTNNVTDTEQCDVLIQTPSDSVKPTQQQYFERFTNIYNELSLLNLDLKQLSDEFKEDYPDADLPNLKAVAKASAEGTLDSKVDKTEAFLEAVESYLGD